MEKEIEVKASYSFWRHPFKWRKEKKARLLLQFYINQQWKNGMKENFYRMNMDVMMYGIAIVDKDGKRFVPVDNSHKSSQDSI